MQGLFQDLSSLTKHLLRFIIEQLMTSEACFEVISFLRFNKFDFLYPVDSQTVVDVTSSFPWDDGTMNLVKTFHVEEARRQDQTG